MHVIEQEMGTLRQGNLSLLQYYDEVETKLTLLTNKGTMSYEASVAQVLCEIFRTKTQSHLFSAKPKDMPSALALAQEVEFNHERLHHLFQEARRIGTKNYFRRRKSANRPILMLIRNQDSNLKWIY